ncbi:MAG: Sulfatase [Myxococcaceae bacterium]|nr:Sulfatase [Myxococcaceae bacterium]
MSARVNVVAHEGRSERAAVRRVSFAVSAALVGLGVQAWVLGLDRVADFARGAGFNACVLLSVWLFFEGCVRLGGRRDWLAWPFYPLSLGLLMLVFAHTWFFDVAIERRLTVLDLSLSGMRYFFSTAVPTPGLWIMAAMFGALFALSCAFTLALGRSPALEQRVARRAPVTVAVLLMLTTPWVVHAARVPSPLFDSAEELWQLASLPRVQTEPRPPDAKWLAALDKSALTHGTEPPRYKHVIVLVMETMTAANFERETEALPAETFLQSERARSQRFERYFPNNQDSRTGMLDMLFSRLVPYEAYSDEGYAQYEPLARAPSLVDRMHELSYATAFAVSQTTLEEVVSELPWDARLHLDEREVVGAERNGSLCFTPDEYERSCEDLVLLPKVLDFVASHERAFVYQEFIWGHAAVYNEVSGKSNAAYYSSYIDALRAGLAARGLLDDTLIALTSDHGFRDKGRQNELSVYRVPLWFHARDLEARTDTRLLSHTDFGLLLFERLAPPGARVSAVPDNELVLIVGPTGQGHLFAVTRAGGQMLLRHRAGRDILLASQAGEPGEHQPSASQLLTLFRRYRERFERRLHASPPR